MKFLFSLLRKASITTAFAVLFGYAPGAFADTYYVDATGNNSNCTLSGATACSTIQAALNLATTSGDIVDVSAGSYSENLVIPTDDITLQTTAGAILNLVSGYGITVTGKSDFTLDGFIVNASTSTTYALKASEADRITVKNSTFYGGAGNTGGGVDFITCNDVTVDNVISNGFHKNGFSFTTRYLSTQTGAQNITFNNITASNNGWSGIALYTVGNDHSDNTSDPSNIGGANSITGVVFSGNNTISGNGSEGIHVQGDGDYNQSQGNTPAYTVTSDGVTLDLTHVAFNTNALDILNYQTAPVYAVGATFGGVTGDNMDASQRTTEDGKIWDKLDNSDLGLVTYYRAKLALVKQVAGEGSASATDWNLKADGTDDNDISGDGGVGTSVVNPDTFLLSESGDVENYTASAWSCVDNNNSGADFEDLSGNELALSAGDDVTCTITNTYTPTPTTSNVTLCKKDESGAPLANWELSLLDQVDSFSVPANAATGVDSSAILENGGTYLVEASGTWQNTGANRNADAEYTSGDNWSSYTNGVSSYPERNELQIDNVDGNWGTYNDTHVYRQTITGDGTSINLRVFEGTGTTQQTGWYSDNVGSLEVTIYHVVLSGVTPENGCISTADVPYGEYSIEETLQNGWKNVSGLGSVTVDEEEETFDVVNQEIPDEVAPLVTITNPIDGAIVSGTVDIRGTLVEDVAMGNWNVSICVVGDDCSVSANRIEQNNVNPAPEDNFTDQTIFTWDTTDGNFPDGNYIIRFAARDAAGNRDLSGDPSLGGDDSQHIITVTVQNDEEEGHTITILKYLDGEPATEGTFHVKDNEGNIISLENDNDYTYTTSVEDGKNYWIRELFGKNEEVDLSCRNGEQYALVGYTKGSEEDAINGTPTKKAPKLWNVDDDQYIIVWNKTCAECDQDRIRELKQEIKELQWNYVHDMKNWRKGSHKRNWREQLQDLKKMQKEYRESMQELRKELQEERENCRG